MKIVYLKYVDPVNWKTPDIRFYEGDLEKGCKLVVSNIAGLLIREDDEKIILGEVTKADDNPELNIYGIEFPYYRDVIIILKKSILKRKDYEVNDNEV